MSTPAPSKPMLCFHVSDGDPETDLVTFATSSIAAKREWANEHGNGPSDIAGISAKRRQEWDCYAPGPVPALEMIDAGWWFECHGCSRKIKSDDIGHPIDHEDDDTDLAAEYGPDISGGVMEPYEPRPQQIWCSRACHDRDMTERRRIKRMEASARRIVGAYVARRWPGVTLVQTSQYDFHVHVGRCHHGYLLIHQVVARFEVPGMSHGGCSLRVDTEKWQHARVEEHGPPVDGSEHFWRRDYYNPGRPRHPAPLAQRTRDVALYCANGDKALWDAWCAEHDTNKAGEMVA